MAHHHHHGHHTHAPADSLRTALFLTVAVLAIEAVAGYLSNSLALLSDAGHILTDVFALGLAWFATRMSSMPPDERNTFGYRRSAILAALVNAGLLIAIAGFVVAEAVVRLRNPEHVNGVPVVLAAALAILVNAFIAFRLRDQGHDDINIRAALLHVVGDIAASAGVIAAGVIMLLWHAYIADPILSVLIALLIAYGAWQIVRDTVTILMEGTPRGIDLEAVRQAMGEIPGVQDVHDLHVWALTDGFRLLSAHVSVPEQSLADTAPLITDLKTMLRRRFSIDHATIELECVDCRVPRPRPIRLEGPPGRAAGA